MIRAYHATNRKFKGFLPYTHFGTAKAANDRIEMLREFSENTVGRDPGEFHIFPVLLDIGNPLRMPDLAALDDNTGLVLEDAWNRFFARTKLNKKKWESLSYEEQDRFDEAPRARGWESEEAVATTLLEMGEITIDEFEDVRKNEDAFKLLESMGYDGVVYTNVVEDPGSDSWIIFSSKQVGGHVHNVR